MQSSLGRITAVEDLMEWPGGPGPSSLGLKGKNHRRKKSCQGMQNNSPPLPTPSAQCLDPPLHSVKKFKVYAPNQ